MHDLDRTHYEIDPEAEEYGEISFEGELPGGTYDRPFSEAELDELALELLSVRSDQELDQFLGDLFKRATRALGAFAKTPAGKALGGILRNTVKSALPILGGAVLPGGGAAAGQAISDALEAEGGPVETRDVEVAKKVVEVSGTAAQQVASLPPDAPPRAANDAVNSALQQQGMAPPTGAGQNGGTAGGGDTATATGRWYRQGRKLIVVGL
jgi:hypothetical protein